VLCLHVRPLLYAGRKHVDVVVYITCMRGFREYLVSFFFQIIMPSALHFVDILAGGCVVYLLKRILSSNRAPPLPPGPKGYPVIGNLLDIPTEREWETYAHWSEEYGMLVLYSDLSQKHAPYISFLKAMLCR
jgi:hypothetical protein